MSISLFPLYFLPKTNMRDWQIPVWAIWLGAFVLPLLGWTAKAWVKTHLF
jgi:hypothetical protein